MDKNTLQHVTKSLNELSDLFNDIPLDLSVSLSELVKIDDKGFIVWVNFDLAAEYNNFFDCLLRLRESVAIFSDKITSLMFCFKLLTNDKFDYVRKYEMGNQ